MEEPLPFEMDRLYADLKAAGESKTMNQHEPRRPVMPPNGWRRASTHRPRGVRASTGRAGGADRTCSTSRAGDVESADARLLNVVLTELTLV